ncbi:oxidoreductase [Ascochyta rabiei]|uniref:Oxidoreductase n=2 Tax=Didymella rabiei TaxID=5454 RepID=A0A163B781_DIDRA|nr:oxidoreductase [Ascochyta rabiei]
MTEEIDYDAITWPAQLTNGVHRSMYPLLEPSNPSLSAAGKTVLVTGASGGIGRAIAQAWTTAGAKGIVITGRRLEALKELESELGEISQGRTKVVVVQADMTQEDEVKQLWQAAAKELGTMDVLINNAGSLTQARLGQDAPSKWWHDFEVNVKAPHLNIHHFLAQSTQPQGTVITLSTGTLGGLYPDFSSYVPSKLASTKVMEFLHAEQAQVRCFSIFPGLVATDMPPRQYLEFARDDPMLSGGLSLFLATPRAEWLRGCVVSVNWDLEEMEGHREEILDKGLCRLGFTGARFGRGGHWGAETKERGCTP